MATRFVKVLGMHNVFDEATSTTLNTSTISLDVSNIADQNSILFITTDKTDETYSYKEGSKYIWAQSDLYNSNNSDEWRPIAVNGTIKQASTDKNKLDLSAGNNIEISYVNNKVVIEGKGSGKEIFVNSSSFLSANDGSININAGRGIILDSSKTNNSLTISESALQLRIINKTSEYKNYETFYLNPTTKDLSSNNGQGYSSQLGRYYEDIMFQIYCETEQQAQEIVNGNYWIRFSYLSAKYGSKKWVCMFNDSWSDGRTLYSHWKPIQINNTTSTVYGKYILVNTSYTVKDMLNDAIILYDKSECEEIDLNYKLEKCLIYGSPIQFTKTYLLNKLTSRGNVGQNISFKGLKRYYDDKISMGAKDFGTFDNKIGYMISESYSMKVRAAIYKQKEWDENNQAVQYWKGEEKIKISDFVEFKLNFEKGKYDHYFYYTIKDANVKNR